MKKVLLVALLMTLAACSSSVENPEVDNSDTQDIQESQEVESSQDVSAPVVAPVDLQEVEDQSASEPVVDQPATEEPTTDEPATDEPATDEPATDEPVTDEPVTDEPTTDEPVADEPAADEPTTDEPATDEPVADEPTTDEPVTDEPATVEPVNYSVDAFDFGYSSSSLNAKVGQEVTVTLNNTGTGSHNFVIDALSVNSGVISGGETTTFTFTPDQAGSFEFYCSIGSHKNMGMLGTLVVSE